MKKSVFVSLLLSAFLAVPAFVSADTYKNPVVPHSLPDPTVIRAQDGMYYLYATEDIHNTPIYCSWDLVHWDFVGTAFTDATRPKMVPGGGLWAPDINYINGQYVLYYSKSEWGGEWTCGIGAATSDNPEGPFKDHGKLFTSDEIDVQNSIDQFYFEDNGHKYLFWGSFHGIYGIELSDDGLSVREGAEKVKISGSYTEGTCIHYHDGYYYLIGSSGSCCEGANSTYQLVVARSENLFGPYLNKSGLAAMGNNFTILLHKGGGVVGPGHCSELIQDDAGQDWILYHGYQSANPDAGRVLYLDPIVWGRDGWPQIKNQRPSTSCTVPVINHSPARQYLTGDPVPLADPYILVDEGKYYAYGTHNANGIEVYESNDLNYWYLDGLALDKANCTEKVNFWAPEVYRRGDTYYMYFSANEHLFVATSDCPKGPFKQVGGYLMEPLLGDTKCIDSSVFQDDNGKLYLMLVRFNDGNCIWICNLNDDGTAPTGGMKKLIAVSQPWEKIMGKVTEGPFMLKRNEKYYLTYSGNDYQSWDYGIGYAYSNAIDRGWRKYAKNPILRRPVGLVGTGHHSFFTDLNGDLRIVFHAHNSPFAIHPRLMYIGEAGWQGDTLTISDTNWFQPVITKSVSVPEPAYVGDVAIASKRVSDTLYILASDSIRWEVVSLHGKVVKQGSTHGNTPVSLLDVPRGMYIINVDSPNGRYSEKFLHI